MDNVIWTLIGGFAVLGFFLYTIATEISNLRNDIEKAKDASVDQLKRIEGKLNDIESELGWQGTLRKQLYDVEKAILRSR